MTWQLHGTELLMLNWEGSGNMQSWSISRYDVNYQSRHMAMQYIT